MAITEFLKYSLPRPELLDLDGSPMHNSFPSGHTTVAAGISLGLILAMPPRWRALAVAPATFLIGIVAVGTIVAGWHRVSDTIGATLIALALFLTAAAIVGLPESARVQASPRVPHPSHEPWRARAMVPPHRPTGV